jgi:hypothetical protein
MNNETKYGKRWKQLETDSLGDISDVATDVFNAVTKRKDRSIASEEEDPYFEDLKKKRRARYEALKEKYKD